MLAAPIEPGAVLGLIDAANPGSAPSRFVASESGASGSGISGTGSSMSKNWCQSASAA